MGIFSSSYKYYAYAGSSNLFAEDERPNTVRSMILESIISNRMGIAEAVMIGINTNLYARAKAMMRYASRENGYVFGFPETNQTQWDLSTDFLRPYIEAEAGGPIDYRSLYWGEWDVEAERFFLERYINLTYMDTNFFPWKNPLGFPADDNWSPVDDEVEVPVQLNGDKGHKEWAKSNNQFNVAITGGTSYQVSFPWTGQEWDSKAKQYVPVSGTFHVLQPYDMTEYQDGTWIRVKYRMQGGGDQYLYWTYKIGSGENPELEDALEGSSLNMQYLPIAILMHDEVWFDEAGDQLWEDTLDRLLKDLALDPYDIKEEYLQQREEDEASGDNSRGNAQDWDFFIHFGVPLKTRNRGGREYLFRLYQWLRARSTWTTFDDYQAWVQGGALGEQPVSKLSVEEGVEYTGYIARYAWSYITEVTFPGSFTPPGWAEPLRKKRYWSDTLELGDPSYSTWLELVHGGPVAIGPANREGVESSYTFIVRQNEDDTHTFILMMGPGMEYQINTSKDPVGVGQGGYVDYRYRFVDCELFPEDPEQDSEFRWPVHIGSIKAVSTMHREEALADGLCATVFLVEQVKVKWYQKGFFKWLIIIIVIVIVVLLWYYGVFAYIGELASAALAAGATGTALAFYALYVVLSFAVGFLISFAGGLIGGTWGQIFVIIATIMAFSARGQGFQLNSAWKNLSTTPSWGSATAFIQAIGPYVKMGQIIYQGYELRKLEDEYRDFLKTAREKYDELQDAWDSLGESPDWLDPLDLLAAQQIGWAEMPETYYNRTLMTNPGVLGYDLIYNFPEIALQLPESDFDKGIVMNMFETFELQRRAV